MDRCYGSHIEWRFSLSILMSSFVFSSLLFVFFLLGLVDIRHYFLSLEDHCTHFIPIKAKLSRFSYLIFYFFPRIWENLVVFSKYDKTCNLIHRVVNFIILCYLLLISFSKLNWDNWSSKARESHAIRQTSSTSVAIGIPCF